MNHSSLAAWILSMILFAGFPLFVNGQSLDELKKQKEKTASEIEYINNLLKENSSNAKASLNRLAVLEKQIRLQDALINNITGEIHYLDTAIEHNSRSIDSLTARLENLKEKYASMIRYAQRNQNSTSQLLFLLSSSDFNQAYKRFIYLRQYGDYRRQQASQIEQYKESINHQLDENSKQKEIKRTLLENKMNQTHVMEKQKAQQNELYSNLKKKDKELRTKLEAQHKVEMRLQHEIERVIAEEVRKSNRKSNSKETEMKLTPEEKVLSNDFSNNKGKFPWPVARGVITDHFGEHPHPVLKLITVRNAGIDLTTQANAKARAIFKGEVSKVVSIPGGNWAVIIRHGNYLTVYSNLVSVTVKTGEKVSTKEEIGTVFTDRNDENKTILKFQLWRENTKLDPENWLIRQ